MQAKSRVTSSLTRLGRFGPYYRRTLKNSTAHKKRTGPLERDPSSSSPENSLVSRYLMSNVKLTLNSLGLVMDVGVSQTAYAAFAVRTVLRFNAL